MSITVTPLYVHVGDLDGQAASSPPLWDAQVTITVHDTAYQPVHDTAYQPVPGISVNGLWSYGSVEAMSCLTDSSGKCIVSKKNLHNSLDSVVFIVSSLSQPGRIYYSSANHDPDGDSMDGTLIIVYRLPQFWVYLPFVLAPGP